MAGLFARNGKLESMFDRKGEGSVALGSPVIIRYLYFFLKHDGRGREQVMISTFAKSEEQKSAAAEAVNYYNPKARFGKDGTFRLSDFGGLNYGHPLCYYTKSYLGETIRLTTKVMELDRLDRRVSKALADGLATLSALPVFTEYLAYASLVQAGVGVAEKLIDFLNRDDAIIESHSLDLYNGKTSGRRLREGRMLCIPDAEEAEFLSSESWKLTPDNRLREVSSGREYTRGSYFVLEVKCEENPAYEKFDYSQNVAELLQKTNRGEDPSEFVGYSAELVKAYQDYRLIDRIEALSLETTADKGDRAKANFRLLTPRMQRLYSQRMREIFQ